MWIPGGPYLVLLIHFALCLATRSYGESWKPQSLDFMDSQLWAADDPKAAHEWASGILDKLAPDSDRRQQIFVATLALNAAIQLEQLEWIKKHEPRIRALWDQALALDMNDQYLSMGQCLAEYLGGSGRHTEAVAVYEQVIKIARALNHHTLLMFTLTYFGQYYRSLGQIPAAFQLMKEAYSLANNPQLNIHPYFREATLLTVAMTLQGEGWIKDSDAVMEKAFAYFEEQHLRSATSVLAYNLATSYSLGMTSDFGKATYYSHKARTLAHSMGDVITEAAALTKLATISNKQNRYTEAVDFANSAVAVVRSRDSMWVALAQREIAEALAHLGQLKPALSAIEQAISQLPENFQEGHADMLQVKSMIEEKLGNYHAALINFQKFHRQLREISLGREQENFAKTKTEMGFQVEEQKNTLLKKEVELQAARLQADRYLKIAAGALAILLLLAMFSLLVAIQKSQQATLAKQKIQRILDLIEEGILTIGPDLKLQANYSPYLANLYPNLEQQSNQDAVSILIPDDFMDSEGKSMVRESLKACLGSDMISWELNNNHLPTEIVFKDPSTRILSVHWQPILDTHQFIRGFLVGIRDITEARLLEDAVVKEQKIVQDLERKLKELLTSKYAEARTLVDSIAKKMDRWTDEVDGFKVTETTRRELHTHKGVARALGLKELSSAIHNLESSFTEPEAIRQLSMQIKQYQHLIQDVLAVSNESNQVKLSLIDILSAPVQLLRKQLQAVRIDWQGIEICDYVEHWPDDLIQTIQGNIIHALTNSADHGYILPKKAGQDPGPAAFRIEAHELPESFRLMIRDQGVGLNRQKLEALARQLNFVPSGDESYADVVFLDGASTTDRLTESSGRGVGMAAIRASCREWGGEAHIHNNPDGPGSELILSFKKMRQSV